MENPDLVLQEKGSSPTHSRFNHVPSGDALRQDAMSSFFVVYFFDNWNNECLLLIGYKTHEQEELTA